MNIKPIKTEAEYQSTLQEIDHLFDVAPNTPEEDYLELLAILVEAYEAQHYPIPLPEPIDAIRHFMEAQQLLPRDLVPYIGSLKWVEEILNRKRDLTLDMIRKLHANLGIPAEVLIQPVVS
ncbi:hypothetical protein QUF64_02995 [Anaerolineales bacterium HSG6]|nr:hypothetical protein [Anaerolineales bacterium HSG6]